MYPCYNKQNWTKILLLTMSYKPVRKAGKRGEISASQLQIGTACSTNVKFLGTGIAIWQWRYPVILPHLCAILYPSKSQKYKNTSVAIAPGVLACLWSCVGCNFKRKSWQQMSRSHLQVFFFSQSLLTLKSLKAAFPMKNNFCLVLSTCIVAQTNRQITMWVHALIIYPPWRAINHE